MPSPFPGMDPYLEKPSLWPEVHGLLITEILTVLKPLVRPHYRARMDAHVTIERSRMLPDIAVVQPPQPLPAAPSMASAAMLPEITPPTLELDDAIPVRRASVEIVTSDDERLVTMIEVLSPINKSPYDERYWRKRERIIQSGVHLIEIDFLRAGQRVIAYGVLPETPYFVTLRRANSFPPYQVWAVQLAESLPVIPVPLLDDDPDVALNLGAIFANAYERGDYAFEIDYTTEPVPLLSEEQAAWADALLREKGLRSA